MRKFVKAFSVCLVLIFSLTACSLSSIDSKLGVLFEDLSTGLGEKLEGMELSDGLKGIFNKGGDRGDAADALIQQVNPGDATMAGVPSGDMPTEDPSTGETVADAEASSSGDGSYSKTVGNYVISFTLPEHWKDICEIEVHSEGINFYHIPSKSAGGRVFGVMLTDDESVLEFGPYTVLDQIDQYYFVLVEQLSVDAPAETEAEYVSMLEEVWSIKDTFTITAQ